MSDHTPPDPDHCAYATTGAQIAFYSTRAKGRHSAHASKVKGLDMAHRLALGTATQSIRVTRPTLLERAQSALTHIRMQNRTRDLVNKYSKTDNSETAKIDAHANSAHPVSRDQTQSKGWGRRYSRHTPVVVDPDLTFPLLRCPRSDSTAGEGPQFDACWNALEEETSVLGSESVFLLSSTSPTSKQSTGSFTRGSRFGYRYKLRPPDSTPLTCELAANIVVSKNLVHGTPLSLRNQPAFGCNEVLPSKGQRTVRRSLDKTSSRPYHTEPLLERLERKYAAWYTTERPSSFMSLIVEREPMLDNSRKWHSNV